MQRRQLLQRACQFVVVSKQGKHGRGTACRQRRILRGQAQVIGCIRACQAQFDAVTGAVFLPVAAESIRKRALAGDGRGFEAARRRTGDTVLACLPIAQQAKIEVVTVRGSGIARIGTLARGVEHTRILVQPLRIAGQHDRELLRVAGGGNRLRKWTHRLPIAVVAIHAQATRQWMHIQRGIA